jgi:hypothetical protein
VNRLDNFMFYEWLYRINESSNVELSDRRYYDALKKHISDFVKRHNDEVNFAQDSVIDYQELLQLLKSISYPRAEQLISAIKTKNKQQAAEALKDFFAYRSSMPRDYNLTDIKWKIYKILQQAEYQFDNGQNSLMDAKKELEWFDSIAAKSKPAIDFMYNSVRDAVARCGEWNGSRVRMSPSFEMSEISEPISSMSVDVGEDKAGFSMFYNSEKSEVFVDDVLDYGDTDFFKDPETQQDYFNLIQEIKKPGSTTRGGKLIILYTARPRNERNEYQDASDSGDPSIPAGIFLANSPDHVSGLAVDLSSSETRDIWRVKMDSNKVILTNDTPDVKYYQAVGKGRVAVKSLSLVAGD